MHNDISAELVSDARMQLWGLMLRRALGSHQ